MVGLLALILGVATAKIIMNPHTRMFEDEFRRTRIFHGMNVVVKTAPYIPITEYFDPQMSLTDQDISNLRDWGFNFIRLGVMWQAVETAPQTYNTTYLAQINDLINKLGDAGIYTLVDAHQDVFTRQICGEGVPVFYSNDLDKSCDYNLVSYLLETVGVCKTLKSFKLEYGPDGFPTIDSCLNNLFSDYYQTPEAASAFENLYQNVGGLRDRFFDYWNVVIGAFKNNKNVIGYDPINEPLPANFLKDLLLLLPGKFDRDVLQGLYQEFYQVVRNNSDDQIIFFEPTQTDLLPLFGGIIFSVGFDKTPGGESNNEYQILNDHTYCCQSSPSACATGEPLLSDADACRKFHEERLRVRSQDAKRLGVGLIISEFGACTGSEACVAEINSVADVCDSHLVSWAYWQFKGYNDYTTSGSYIEGLYEEDGTLQQDKLKALSRTYVKAFQGIPEAVSFNTETGEFTAEFEVDTFIEAPTEVYLNEALYYPNGYSYSIENNKGLKYEVEVAKNSLKFAFTSGERAKITLNLQPL